MKNKLIELDPLIHQPIRTKIMTYLASVGESDYVSIKKALKLSDGHMSTHIKKLTEANYIEFKKEFIDNKPKTTYWISSDGKKKYKEYIASIKKLIAS